MDKYRIKNCFSCQVPPANVNQKLQAVKSAYGEKIESVKKQIEELKQQRWEELRTVLGELQQHPEVLPVGTKFIYYHRIKARRIELEITQVTVRPVFEIFDLVYVCKTANGDQIEVCAGSMELVEEEAGKEVARG